MAFYLGEVGIAPSELYECTMQELFYINKGYFDKTEKQWLQTRSIMASIINCFAKESVSPSELVPLELDKKIIKYKPKTEQEIEELKETFKKAESLIEFKNWLKCQKQK